MCVERRGCLAGLLGHTWAMHAGEVGQAGPVQLGHAGMEKGGVKRSGWPGRAQLPAGFRPTTK
jgi:hypothetical protein